jgi:hypothetical protein
MSKLITEVGQVPLQTHITCPNSYTDQHTTQIMQFPQSSTTPLNVHTQPTCMTCLKAFSNSSSSSAMRSFSIMRAASASDLYTPRQYCYNEHNKQATAESSGL